jgi:hypothetical protein
MANIPDPDAGTEWVSDEHTVTVTGVTHGRPGDGTTPRRWGAHTLTDPRWVSYEADAHLTSALPIQVFVAIYKPKET